MGDVVKLVPSTVSKETVETLAALLQEARAGKITGLTYVALEPGRRFSSDVVGTARATPVFALGTLNILRNYLESLAINDSE